jgi:ABC-type branched-subunit amino acid transport system permease subunit
VQEYLQFALLGLSSGAIYATVSLGLVMMHRASGVINFAHAAMALWAIYTYNDLRIEGRLILPIPAVPAVDLGAPLGFVPAFAIAVASTTLLGVAVYLLVFRHLEHAPVLARIVATVGLLVAIGGQLHVLFPSQTDGALFVPPILPSEPVTLAGATVSQDRLWLAGLALVAAAGLSALYRHTTFGLATRAAAGSQKGAVLVGRDPRRIALGNWLLASALAGVFGVLVAPTMTIAPHSVVLLVVPALAAAMLAGFRSFWIACVAGLVLGMVESELISIQTTHSWLPQGTQTIVPLVVIIAVAFVRGHGTMRRDDLAQDRLPRSPCPVNVARNAVLGALGCMAALALTSGNIRLGLIVSLMGTVVVLSLVLVTGYLGQVSLMQLTFTGLSGLLLSSLASEAGVPFPVAPLLAAVCAAALGLVLGTPALRVRGTSLAVVTLSAAVATEELVFSSNALSGGIQGTEVSAPTIAGVDLNILGDDYPSFAFGMLVLVVTVAVATAVANLRRSPSGLRMLAIRVNERAAASSGIDVAQTKLAAFTLAAFISGIAGALFAYQQVRFDVSSFGILTSLLFLAAAYISGITSVSGAFLAGLIVPGGLLLSLVNEVWEVGNYELLLAGTLLMVNAVTQPEGFVALLERARGLRRSRGQVRAVARAAAR